MFIKITSVIAGSECQHKYYSDYHKKEIGTNEIDMDWAQEAGLWNGYRWMSNIRVGDTIVINTDVAEKLPEIAAGNFTYEEIVAKYMNRRCIPTQMRLRFWNGSHPRRQRSAS